MPPATLLQTCVNTPPEIRASQPLPTGEGVLDPASFRTIEGERLFEAVNHARTLAGQAVLHRSLAQPPGDHATAQSRQDAVRELREDPELRGRLEALVQQAAEREEDFFVLLFGTFLGQFGSPANAMERQGYGHETYRNGTAFLLNFADGIAASPTPHSDYLRSLFGTFGRFAASRAATLMRGPAYFSERAMLTRAEKGWLTPAVRFTPHMFKPVFLALAFAVGWAVVEFVPILLDLASVFLPSFWMFLLPFALLYFPVVGGFDRDSCIYPLRGIFRKSPEVQAAVDALGQVDELLGFLRYAEAEGGVTTLPRLLEGERHALSVTAARNPVLGKTNPDYVPNGIELKDVQLTFITGPNSGGKTAFCKTLAQIQLLAQIGCPVPAEKAELTVADRIFYQAPEAGALEEGEGRFGTELKRTKAIFLASTPKSLVVLDELSEGTTTQEKLEISANILEGFHKKGNNTLLITHNHELVDLFQDQNVGQARQVEFVGEHPTHRLIPGISRVSHAHRIARKIGFAKEDIAKYLEEHGI
ncbi:MAG TPA: DNA mismatch repair protein MutS [Methylococcaceae bacterium]|nr:DNA mismatch repair protein MutS [Methylococcaceae bacterium]